MRRKLIEHNWIDIRSKLSNPSQTLHRFKKQSDESLGDLALLAETLPYDNLRRIFTHDKIKKLLDSILYGKSDPIRLGYTDILDAGIGYDVQRAQIAALMARIGIDFCIEQYESRIEQSSVLNESVINQLKGTIKICDEIVTKMYLGQVRSRAEMENLIYLFDFTNISDTYEKSLDEIRNEDIRKFIEFCAGELADAPIVKVNKIYGRVPTANVEEIIFDFVDISGDHVVGSFAVWDVNNSATLYDSENKPVRDLLGKTVHNKFYIYIRP